jgi:hypothetical protein
MEDHMKGKVVLVLTLAIFLLLGLCAPASASPPPEQGTFTLGSFDVTADPGESFLTGNILHFRNGVSVGVFSELPWGQAISGHETVIRSEVDITTGFGSATSKTVDVYPTGIVEGTVLTELQGLAEWTYAGPPLTFGTITIATGQTFFGLFTTILAVKHGVTGELKGLETRETATGVVILNPDLTPAGMSVAYATGTYIWLK